ncbi:hypothetical protein LCGC14_1332860 [marine sediment metagenome]|uniref:Uncharacterized protein n=1 Tax=marine sediment metagenome TaxID=412755 RepID=A0A0F9MWV8_9ZZZZ
MPNNHNDSEHPEHPEIIFNDECDKKFNSIKQRHKNEYDEEGNKDSNQIEVIERRSFSFWVVIVK